MRQTKEVREDIVAFTFCGETYEVQSGRDALKRICTFMRIKDAAKFQMLPEVIQYRDKKWFACNPDGMFGPHRFEGTTVWLDTNLKTADIKKIAYDVTSFFGYRRSDLTFASVVRSKRDK